MSTAPVPEHATPWSASLSSTAPIWPRPERPALPVVLRLRKEWSILAEDRERALAKRHQASVNRYNAHAKPLAPVGIGDTVLVQNQTGIKPLRWDKTGRIVQVNEHGQYIVRMDGSGRSTLRNRKFLRPCRPFCADVPLDHHLDLDQKRPETTPQPQVSQAPAPMAPVPQAPVPQAHAPQAPEPATIHIPEPRRSTRVRRLRQLFAANMPSVMWISRGRGGCRILQVKDHNVLGLQCLIMSP
jgi:hypothetical protein